MGDNADAFRRLAFRGPAVAGAVPGGQNDHGGRVRHGFVVTAGIAWVGRTNPATASPSVEATFETGRRRARPAITAARGRYEASLPERTVTEPDEMDRVGSSGETRPQTAATAANDAGVEKGMARNGVVYDGFALDAGEIFSPARDADAQVGCRRRRGGAAAPYTVAEGRDGRIEDETAMPARTAISTRMVTVNAGDSRNEGLTKVVNGSSTT